MDMIGSIVNFESTAHMRSFSIPVISLLVAAQPKATIQQRMKDWPVFGSRTFLQGRPIVLPCGLADQRASAAWWAIPKTRRYLLSKDRCFSEHHHQRARDTENT
ncbi:hypothetical protein RAD16_02465 [Bradyrhizobium sp. 18BD]